MMNYNQPPQQGGYYQGGAYPPQQPGYGGPPQPQRPFPNHPGYGQPPRGQYPNYNQGLFCFVHALMSLSL